MKEWFWNVWISFEKWVGLWLRKNEWYVFHLYFHPEIVLLKSVKFLTFYNSDLKIINDFLVFRLVLVNATESIMRLCCLDCTVLIWKKKNLWVNIVGMLVWTILGLRCSEDEAIGNRELTLYILFRLDVWKQNFLSSQYAAVGRNKKLSLS